MQRSIILLTFICIGYLSCNTTQGSSHLANIENTTDVAYQSHIKPIIANNCLTCHAGNYPSANMTLDTYDKVVDAVQNRNLLKRINDPKNPMPTSGLMSRQERLAIQKWVDNDFAQQPKNPISSTTPTQNAIFTPPNIKAVDIEKEGFDFLEKMQGHWVGKMFLLGRDLPWFAFDFRAINESEVHGLFEGGSMGNLFNTFFVANYKGVKTIMLRNGGILSGIYRTSYFVLTDVKNGEYLFEDAYGGQQIMWVKISFNNDKMKMLTYTSKLGMQKASRHMEFEGKRVHTDLAQQAAQAFNYPSKKVVKSFPDGMPLAQWGSEYPTVTSASYIMSMDQTTDYITLGQQANDPIQITDINNIASLQLQFKRNDLSKGKNISVYLSRAPLTSADGSMKMEHNFIAQSTMDEIILFPEIDKNDNDFTLTYLHTGKCYITFTVDNNKDLVPSKGDYYSASIELDLSAGKTITLEVDQINKQM